MARMVIIYKTLKSPAEFDQHYFNTHIPMAKKLPGLKKYEVSKGAIIALAGVTDPYLIGTLHFDSLEALKRLLHRNADALVLRIVEFWLQTMTMYKCFYLTIRMSR